MSGLDAPDTSLVARSETLAAAAQLLKEAGITRPPTPVEDIIARLGIEVEKFALSDRYTDRNLPVPLAQAQADLRPLVRGMVDVTANVVYIHRNLGREQGRFVTLHELGHYYLDWHNSLLQSCSESDLSPDARRAWEREANLFAKALLFQGRRFSDDAARSYFGWQALRGLARNYGASLEAAGGEFVQARQGPCLLMVAALGDEASRLSQATSGQPLLQVRYAVASRPWWDRFGKSGMPTAGAALPWDHPATRMMLAGRSRGALSAQTTIPLPNGAQMAVKAELLSNGFDILMLAQPV